MEGINALKPMVVVGNGLYNKILRFLGAFLLSEVILIDSVFKFVQNLNTKGMLGLGSEFTTSALFWGDGIWLNLLRLVTVIIFAGIFGLILGYMSRRISMSDKIIYSTLNSIVATLGLSAITYILVGVFSSRSDEVGTGIAYIFTMIESSTFILMFFLLNLIGIFVASFLGIGYGIKLINNPYNTIDRERTGTLLGVKWYHYIWVSLSLGIYGQIIINLIFITGHTLVTLIRNFHWYELFGVTTSGNSEETSIGVAWGKIFWIYIAGAGVFYALNYLREILSGEKELNLMLKILVSVGVTLVIPFLVLMFVPVLFG